MPYITDDDREFLEYTNYKLAVLLSEIKPRPKTDGKIIKVEIFRKHEEQQKSRLCGKVGVLQKNKERRFDTQIFNEKEYNLMPKKFRDQFRVGKITAHVRLKNNGVYEVRSQICGVKLCGASKSLVEAKEKYIKQLKALDNCHDKKPQIIFVDYMKKWLETVKEPYIKENTYKEYLRLFNNDIMPYFKMKKIKDIRAFELQEYISAYNNKGKNRTAKKIYQLLSPVFNFAVADGVLDRSPMLKVVLGRYEQKHGVALTVEEEKMLINLLKDNGSSFLQAFAFMIYTGVRRAELSTVELDKGWITITSAKQRKGYKDKIRSMPVPPMLENILHLIDVSKIKKLRPNELTIKFKHFFPEHHLHELRHTFITRCQECGIRREFVSMWVGHAADSSITSLVYTHLNQNKTIQEEEISKFTYNF